MSRTCYPLLPAVLGAASCVAPLDLSATRFSCDEAAPDCPAGFECVGARCVPADGGATDASGGTDAGPAPSCPATEGFVAVEPGQFVMGEEPWTPCVCAQPLNLAYQPDHLVRITRPFLLQRTEVTRSQYAECVRSGSCREPDRVDELEGGGLPVVGVDRDQAQEYCEWIEGRLPTEAEWEYAARGRGSFLFPWGDKWPGDDRSSACLYAHFSPGDTRDAQKCVQGSTCQSPPSWCDDHQCDLSDTRQGACPAGSTCDDASGPAPVGGREKGASQVLALDMAGNVAEWVLDRWDHERYAREEASGPVVSDPVDPLPLSGDRTPADKAVVRGGHWQDSACGLFSARRVPMEPGTRSATVGFR